MIDLTNFRLDELRSLEMDVSAQLERLQDQQKSAAREQIFAIAKSVGLPLSALLSESQGVKPLKGMSAPIRFRNPGNQNESWSGRGRQPKWIREWLGSGKAIDDLRVSLP